MPVSGLSSRPGGAFVLVRRGADRPLICVMDWSRSRCHARRTLLLRWSAGRRARVSSVTTVRPSMHRRPNWRSFRRASVCVPRWQRMPMRWRPSNVPTVPGPITSMQPLPLPTPVHTMTSRCATGKVQRRAWRACAQGLPASVARYSKTCSPARRDRTIANDLPIAGFVPRLNSTSPCATSGPPRGRPAAAALGFRRLGVYSTRALAIVSVYRASTVPL